MRDGDHADLPHRGSPRIQPLSELTSAYIVGTAKHLCEWRGHVKFTSYNQLVKMNIFNSPFDYHTRYVCHNDQCYSPNVVYLTSS